MIHCDRIRRKLSQTLRGRSMSNEVGISEDADNVEASLKEVDELILESVRPKRVIKLPAQFNDFVV